MPTYNAITARTDADALIPEETSREIIKNLPQQSAALTLMRKTTMSSKQTKMPVQTALAQAYWVGGDTGLKQTTKEAWANKHIVAEELAAIVPIPEAVLDDADYPLWDEIRPDLEEAAGALIDMATIFGVGKPASWTSPAIVPGAAAAGNAFTRGSVAGQDVIGDLNDTFALPEGDGFQVNGVAADTTLRSSLRGLRTGDGAFLLQGGETGAPATIYGERLAYINNGAWDTAQADAIAGDWTKAIVAVRQDFTFKVFTEGVISDDSGNVILNLMQQDSAALRMVMRVGYAVANPISRRASVEANRFPFGVLRPAGFVG